MIDPKPVKVLRIYIGETDRWEHRPLYEALMDRARQAGLAGATLFRGAAGYGASSTLHTAKILRLSDDLPLVLEIVDREEKIQAFLPEVSTMVRAGMITLLDAQAVILTEHPLEGGNPLDPL